MTFSRRIARFCLLLVAILAIPSLMAGVRRPWRELDALIERSRAWLEALVLVLEEQELQQLAEFALAANTFDLVTSRGTSLADDPTITEDSYEWWASGQGFYLAIESETLLPETEVLATFAEQDLEFADFDYAVLQHWHEFWLAKFSEWPGIAERFGTHLDTLRTVHARANEEGLRLAQLYILTDPIAVDAQNSIYVSESLEWWESTPPGDAYVESTSGCAGWIEALFPGPADDNGNFYHNRVADPCRFFLPEFERDAWGVWFGAWKTQTVEVSGAETTLYIGIDFSAARVVQLMATVGGLIIVLGAIIGALVILVTRRYALWLSQPIDALRSGASAVVSGDLDHVVPQFALDEFRELIDSFNRMIAWTAERLNLKDTITKLLSEDLAESAASEGMSLGGEERPCTIMFTDFAGFSSITESLPASDTVDLLNQYFSIIVPIIQKHGGFPDKYIGDGVLAMFGAPMRLAHHAQSAVRCAIELQQTLREFNDKRRQSGEIVFEMRVGLNSGPVVIGAIGCDTKLEYTSIGEVTTRASRIEGLCQIGQVMMSRYTFDLVKDLAFEDVRFETRPQTVAVKGYDYPVDTYSIYISDVVISKTADTTNPAAYYSYQNRKV